MRDEVRELPDVLYCAVDLGPPMIMTRDGESWAVTLIIVRPGRMGDGLIRIEQ